MVQFFHARAEASRRRDEFDPAGKYLARRRAQRILLSFAVFRGEAFGKKPARCEKFLIRRLARARSFPSRPRHLPWLARVAFQGMTQVRQHEKPAIACRIEPFVFPIGAARRKSGIHETNDRFSAAGFQRPIHDRSQRAIGFFLDPFLNGSRRDMVFRRRVQYRYLQNASRWPRMVFPEFGLDNQAQREQKDAPGWNLAC